MVCLSVGSLFLEQFYFIINRGISNNCGGIYISFVDPYSSQEVLFITVVPETLPAYIYKSIFHPVNKKVLQFLTCFQIVQCVGRSQSSSAHACTDLVFSLPCCFSLPFFSSEAIAFLVRQSEA